jgi:hypothetical protein
MSLQNEERATQHPGTTAQTAAGAMNEAASAANQPATNQTNEETTDRNHEETSDRNHYVPLISPERAREYQNRWNELKSEFVDEPRRAVREASVLVGHVLDELEGVFRRQHRDLTQGLDHEETSTEELRLAFGKYRSFFHRLLSF